MLPVQDRGFLLGDGVFETVRIYRGVAFALDRHLARLRAGSEALSMDYPSGLQEGVQRTIAANALNEGALRITLSRGLSSGPVWPTGDGPSSVVISAREYSTAPHWYDKGVEGHLVESRLNEHAATAGIKTISYLESVLAQREAFERGAHEAIRLNTAGALAEGAVSNLFLVHDGGLATPGLQCGALPGITRQLVLELADQTGVTADGNAVLHPQDLANADEAFLTNSLREIVPLVKLDGAAIGDGRPGSVTLSLLDSYRGMVDDITKPF